MSYIEELGYNAVVAERTLMSAPTKMKNDALRAISDALIENVQLIIDNNRLDINNAIKQDMSVSMQDRLTLDDARIKAIASSVLDIIKLDDPIGEVEHGTIRPNGIKIQKTRVPLGVIGIIYESRPNVTVDAAILCLKTGNSVILKGGKEAYHSNKCLVEIMRNAIEASGLPKDCIQYVNSISREDTKELMRCNKYLDVLIPRGSARLINAVKEQASVAVIETGTGNCHVYVDKSADLEMAVNIVDNGKTQRPSVCNAVESLLVHKDIAKEFLPLCKERLDQHGVEIRGCDKTLEILSGLANVTPASEDDYATEFLDYIISVKVVDSTDCAIEHISKYTTKHSECIVTNSLCDAEKFQNEVDAAAVYVNASTRFTDGGEFGLGAEIGISTQKLHARGPMGLDELTSVKYLINGNGQIR